VRQGSVGGPMKWVVFMNFWLEYVHSTAKGTGYKMNSSAPEVIGQMFIDDSNWIMMMITVYFSYHMKPKPKARND
jgi:hypothetical protein